VGYVASLPSPSRWDPLDPRFIEELEAIGVEETEAAAVRDARHSLAQVRRYAKDDLFAVAEVAYMYLFGGQETLARILFEGLAAVDPREPYFALALGLAHDLEGNLDRAEQSYRRASKLDPTDPRADVNRAEILIEKRQYREAKKLLGHAHSKQTSDPALATKIVELSRQIDRIARRRV
jgi:Flp pilus assembly protein TadD